MTTRRTPPRTGRTGRTGRPARRRAAAHPAPAQAPRPAPQAPAEPAPTDEPSAGAEPAAAVSQAEPGVPARQAAGGPPAAEPAPDARTASKAPLAALRVAVETTTAMSHGLAELNAGCLSLALSAGGRGATRALRLTRCRTLGEALAAQGAIVSETLRESVDDQAEALRLSLSLAAVAAAAMRAQLDAGLALLAAPSPR